jgi:hypothetical protein
MKLGDFQNAIHGRILNCLHFLLWQVLPDSIEPLDYAIAFPPGSSDELRSQLSTELLKLQVLPRLATCAWPCAVLPALLVSFQGASPTCPYRGNHDSQVEVY